MATRTFIKKAERIEVVCDGWNRAFECGNIGVYFKYLETMKYVLGTISGVHTQIARNTNVIGYTEGVLEVFLPETDKWSEAKIQKWIAENNKRMEAICKLLNDEKL